MGWERGYYYRVRKENGRVVREYFGSGEPAAVMAQLDALEREQRQRNAMKRRQVKDELKALDADLEAMSEEIELAARAALLAAGFHQHKRGEWRKRREQDDNTNSSQAEQA